MSGWLTRLDPGAGGMRDWGWVGEVLTCSLSLFSSSPRPPSSPSLCPSLLFSLFFLPLPLSHPPFSLCETIHCQCCAALPSLCLALSVRPKMVDYRRVCEFGSGRIGTWYRHLTQESLRRLAHVSEKHTLWLIKHLLLGSRVPVRVHVQVST